MVNGKPGDHPYTDMLGHGMDLGEPEIAARLREVDSIAELDVKHILSDLVEYLFPGRYGMPPDYQRERLLRHLAVIEKLCAGAGAKAQK
jgi:hypothetical protein